MWRGSLTEIRKSRKKIELRENIACVSEAEMCLSYWWWDILVELGSLEHGRQDCFILSWGNPILSSVCCSALRRISLWEAVGGMLYEVKDCAREACMKHLFSLQETAIWVSEELCVSKCHHLWVANCIRCHILVT